MDVPCEGCGLHRDENKIWRQSVKKLQSLEGGISKTIQFGCKRFVLNS